MAITRRKFVAFALVSAVLSALVVVTGVLAADLYLHHRAERSAGLNRWGYRGPVVGWKRPGELRMVVLGGSTAFGYGVTADETVPAILERLLNERGSAVPARVINLGFNNEGVFALLPTLEDFDFLNYDIACFYAGYNDLLGDISPNRAVYRRESPIFRLTGYFPILPTALGEKALSLRYGGNLEAAYAATRGADGGKTVFKPSLASRTSATALEATAQVADVLGRQLDRMASQPPTSTEPAGDTGCAPPWAHYCDAVYRAAEHALSLGKRVLIVAQPTLRESGRHALQTAAMADMVARKFRDTPRVRYVDLSDAVDLTDTDSSFDGMHLNVNGNVLVAQALVDPVRSLVLAGDRNP